jgi:precorrin-6A synthase
VGPIRTVYVIGIGAGDPQFLTGQAIDALNRSDVFFFVDKPNATGDLASLRTRMCERFVTDHPYRIVHAEELERDRTSLDYDGAVARWRDGRTRLYEQLIRDELGEDQAGAFLVWGDPGLYDGTLTILDDVLARGAVTFDCVVVPGISSVQALTARHRIAMNRVGGSVHITTGRRLAGGDLSDDTFVMLDAGCAFTQLGEAELDGYDIYWGAYLGTADEVLIAGTLREVSALIVARRAQLRARHGWIMDTYLLRKRRTVPTTN